jgi:hypothetical protein
MSFRGSPPGGGRGGLKRVIRQKIKDKRQKIKGKRQK